ncbi:ribonuclease HI family protein [Patescibacteria group bacterium]|nr:ribonuclease HI family protein [Patescibacteria group bacterium]
MEVSIYTDGGARGNPGISGFGLVVLDQSQKIIHQQSQFLGIKTNNEAEYLGLIAALTWLKDNYDSLSITQANYYSDSQLLVRQIKGSYKVKAQNLLPLFLSAKTLLSQIPIPFHPQDIRRHHNQLADSLANQAMDRR